MFTNDDLKALQLIANLPGSRLEANTPDLRYATDRLYDLGVLNISPPGWSYVVNAAGRATLAAALAPAAPAQERAA